jgi:hypothetical protein
LVTFPWSNSILFSQRMFSRNAKANPTRPCTP